MSLPQPSPSSHWGGLVPPRGCCWGEFGLCSSVAKTPLGGEIPPWLDGPHRMGHLFPARPLSPSPLPPCPLSIPRHLFPPPDISPPTLRV